MKTIYGIVISLVATVRLVASDTYFDYSDKEMERLKKLETRQTMNTGELWRWDQVAQRAISKSRMPHFKGLRVWTYLYMAQAEAAKLSNEVKETYAGSLDPVSREILALFLPSSRYRRGKEDAYSQELARIVVAKFKERMKEEDKQGKEFKIPEDKRGEYGEGTYIASWKPFYLDDPEDYWPSKPPRSRKQWQEEVEGIKSMQRDMTREKREAVRYWAGMSGQGSGDWRVIANRYLKSHRMGLEKALQVRSVLGAGLYDGFIVCFGAKYHYMVDRPKVRDESVHYEIEVPKHPSYPAGHSVEANVAATILSKLLPANSEQWWEMAEQSCLSRIWGGIHYPVDDEAGRKAGKKVAEEVLDESGN